MDKLNPLHTEKPRTDFPTASQIEWEHAAPEARATHEQRMDAVLAHRNGKHVNREKEA
jgi:hypothetical protein